MSFGTSVIGTSSPVARAQADSTGERRSEQHRTGQNRTEQDRTEHNSTSQDRTDQNKAEVQPKKDQEQKRQQERATYRGSSLVTQCLFLVQFPFFSSLLYGGLTVALRSSEVQFPTTTTKRTNTQTNVVLQALSWKGQRGLLS